MIYIRKFPGIGIKLSGLISKIRFSLHLENQDIDSLFSWEDGHQNGKR